MVSTRKAKPTESAWEIVLSSLGVSEELSKLGYVEIQATELKRMSGLEPRILAKMDFSSQRPKSFVERNLNILPIQNGNYRIGQFDVFKKIEKTKNEPIFVNSPMNFQSISDVTSSEGIALRKAEISTMIDRFSGEHVVHTFSGRERSPNFDFRVKNYDKSYSTINVSGVQIEVDGGFEGENSIYIFEVKNQSAEDFNVRQLYFPYRTYMAKATKPIRCIYLVHAYDVFNFFEYRFVDPLNMSSIELVQSQSYYLKNPVIKLEQVLISNPKKVWRPPNEVPFPQADLITAVIEIVKIAGASGVTTDELIESLEFTSRQLEVGGGYYPNAAKYLGLAYFDNSGLQAKLIASEDFQSAARSGDSEVTSLVISRISQIPGVRGILDIWVKENRIASLNEVVTEMQVFIQFSSLSETTQKRRAQTIRAWCIWVIQHSS